VEDVALRLINEAIEREGGYVNHPNDPGGETNWGITIGTARANGYTGSMKSLSRRQAVEIYYSQYWLKPGLDKVFATGAILTAAELFDTGINMGPAWAGRFLQDGLNVLEGVGIPVDGQIGPKTLGALRAYINKRRVEGDKVLAKLLDCFQGDRYAVLVRNNERNRSFIFGWLRTRIGNVDWR
jgi:lysozyme family protein